MQKVLKPHEINSLDNFIKGWYISEDICDKFISYNEDLISKKIESKYSHFYIKEKGYLANDLNLSFPPDMVEEYIKALFEVVNSYKEIYPACYQDINTWGLHPHINIQKYLPGDSYKNWHCECTGYDKDLLGRSFVFITYLNSVTDGGETEFLHQKLKVKPEKGLTILWPTYWPWLHRGLPSLTQEKTIITGWFHYVYQDEQGNWKE